MRVLTKEKIRQFKKLWTILLFIALPTIAFSFLIDSYLHPSLLREFLSLCGVMLLGLVFISKGLVEMYYGVAYRGYSFEKYYKADAVNKFFSILEIIIGSIMFFLPGVSALLLLLSYLI